jgi:signal peptidase II
LADTEAAPKASPKADQARGRPAWRSPTAVAIFLLVSLAGAAGDLASKHAVFGAFLDRDDLAEQVRRHRMPGDDTRTIILRLQEAGIFDGPVMPGVNFRFAINPGTAFGSSWMPPWAVKVATIVTIVLVGCFFAGSPRRAYLTHAALACIVGGAIGNLYDRIHTVVALPGEGLEPIRGHVRDFVDLSALHYPYVFNIADVLLVVGVGVMMLSWILAGRKEKPAARRTNA